MMNIVQLYITEYCKIENQLYIKLSLACYPHAHGLEENFQVLHTKLSPDILLFRINYSGISLLRPPMGFQ